MTCLHGFDGYNRNVPRGLDVYWREEVAVVSAIFVDPYGVTRYL